MYKNRSISCCILHFDEQKNVYHERKYGCALAVGGKRQIDVLKYDLPRAFMAKQMSL